MSITGSAAKNAKAKLDELKKSWAKDSWGQYVPPTGSKEDYDKLTAAVDEATRRNESQAALQRRIEQLGGSVLSLAKTLGVLA